nr:hypothetical protein [Tanacetum cinerariifolium]
MSVPASPEHVPAIPDQLLVEPPLAPNPPKLDNDYLDVVDYDDEEEPYEDLDDEEEDPKEDPKMDLDEEEEDPEMDLDEEEEDPEMDIDDEEKEEPLPASPPPLSPQRTPPPVSKSSSNFDILVTTTTTVGRPFKGPRFLKLTKRLLRLDDVYTAMDKDRIEKTQDQEGKQIRELRHRLTSAKIRLEVASVDWYRLECELYSVRAQMHAIQQELYWRGLEENRPTESIDVLPLMEINMPPKIISNAAIERMIADRVDAEIAIERTTAAAKAAKVARAVATAETTRVVATAGDAECKTRMKIPLNLNFNKY